MLKTINYVILTDKNRYPYQLLHFISVSGYGVQVSQKNLVQSLKSCQQAKEQSFLVQQYNGSPCGPCSAILQYI